MPGNLRWNGIQFMALLRAELRRRIFACCILVANHARDLLNVDGTLRAIRKTTYWYGGRKRTVRKKSLIYGSNPSKPGEPPHKQTGRLLGSVAQEVSEVHGNPIGRVGTNVPYGRALELGASGDRDSAWGKPTRVYRWVLLARPWLRRALKERVAAVKAILYQPWNP